MITPTTIFERTRTQIARWLMLDTASDHRTAIPSDRQLGQRRSPRAEGSATTDSGRLAHTVRQS